MNRVAEARVCDMGVPEAADRKSAVAEPEQATAVNRPLHAALLTGGQDPHYVYGLATALAGENVALDVIGSENEDCPAMHDAPKLRFLRLYGRHLPGSAVQRLGRMLLVYARLIGYGLRAKPRLFHILWNYKLSVFDRTLLMLLFKLRGRKIVLTAHNVNAGRRDGRDTLLNRVSLRVQYRLADHTFVHTEKMKTELLEQFRVSPGAVTVIPYGMNNAVPNSERTTAEARRLLGLRNEDKVVLYFGAIKPYKGLEYLVKAFDRIGPQDTDYKLLIAGERKKGSEAYLGAIEQMIDSSRCRAQILQRIRFIPDDEVELYFKAADVIGLPYTEIFQSGILFLAYSFGLPVIATDVGSFRECVLEDKTGFVCKPHDAADLGRVIERYFGSDLYRRREQRRPEIRDYVMQRHSWRTVASMTHSVYASLLPAGRA
jgi:glycosyltransferase involved in cell wall biosynthesis